MSQGELIYLVGVIVAFCAFAVTLAIVSHGQHLPPIGSDEQPAKPKVASARP